MPSSPKTLDINELNGKISQSNNQDGAKRTLTSLNYLHSKANIIVGGEDHRQAHGVDFLLRNMDYLKK
ncbi:hypothetical protein [Piscirickettsia litoralis]|uniref:Haem-binding uptake Tiki superfamily ChaN domain-containing protein n=1 Tax=Piscirickettsia litoralis TaxID=1891921 RepID=A0ABX3A0B2_9GAMM|nr:hypothetical protein [Piscirickettsia litoralis]ODN42272.1 hypothetical protein BGC07_04140 [Piscirickettsia litoralis]